MNKDGTHTNKEAFESVARMKTTFLPPYKLIGYAPSGNPTALAKFRDDIAGQELQTLEEVYSVFRGMIPEGQWIMFLHGRTPGFKRPGGFLDTAMMEKAARYEAKQKERDDEAH